MKLKLLDQVAAAWDGCTRCDLAASRNKIVHWRGDPNARLAIIGEGPGAHEDEQGLPFVGSAGRLVDELLKRAGLTPSDVFIVNMVGCRPPGKRWPERDEIKACSPRLEMMLRVVRPRALLLLGATAARLAGITAVMSHRGKRVDVDVLCADGKVRSWPAIATLNPDYVIRTGGTRGETFQAVLGDVQEAWKLAQFS